MKRIVRHFQALICALLALFAVGCRQAPDQIYDDNGIVFSYPGDWSVTDEEMYDTGSILYVEKNGTSSSGVAIIVNFEKGSITPFEWLDGFIGSMKENPMFGDLEVAPYPYVLGAYGKYPARVITYAMSVIGFAHSGTIRLIETGDRFVAVTYQEADEDNVDNRAGFDLIESTFIIK